MKPRPDAAAEAAAAGAAARPDVHVQVGDENLYKTCLDRVSFVSF